MPKFKYQMFVEYIKSNPGLKRVEITKNMGYVLRSRGQLSKMWSKLISSGRIYFDKSYRYYAT